MTIGKHHTPQKQDGDVLLEDSEGVQVDILPTAKDRMVPTSTISVFTDPIQRCDVVCQARERNDASAQTDVGMQTNPELVDCPDEIRDFLSRVEPRVLAALQDQASRGTFNSDDGNRDTSNKAPIKLLHTLEGVGDNPHDLECTCLSWNCTGRTIALAYGRSDLNTWCAIPGVLATWNLGREGQNTRPDVKIECTCCLTACAFHPKMPALIACGTLNGDLYVWDIGAEGDLQVGKSSISDVSHQDSIAEIVWQYNPQSTGRQNQKDMAYQLITLGADGRLLIWICDELQNPIYGYELNSPAPRTYQQALWGGSSMGLQKDGGNFLIGTIGGRIFSCSLDFNDAMCQTFQAASMDNEAVNWHWRSPIKGSEFEDHSGPIYGIGCSPFQRDLFLSSGADGSVHLFSVFSGKPLLKLEPTSCGLTSVQWSPTRPLVFAAGTGDGKVVFFNLMESSFHPCACLEASRSGKAVRSISFNHHFQEWFATSQGSTAKVWQLGEHMTSSQQIEIEILQFIAEGAAAGQNGAEIFQQFTAT